MWVSIFRNARFVYQRNHTSHRELREFFVCSSRPVKLVLLRWRPGCVVQPLLAFTQKYGAIVLSLSRREIVGRTPRDTYGPTSPVATPADLQTRLLFATVSRNSKEV